MGGACGTYGAGESDVKGSGGETWGKETIRGRPRRRWDDNIKIGLQEVGGSCEGRMELTQDSDRWRTLLSRVMKLWVPKMRGISWLAAETVNF